MFSLLRAISWQNFLRLSWEFLPTSHIWDVSGLSLHKICCHHYREFIWVSDVLSKRQPFPVDLIIFPSSSTMTPTFGRQRYEIGILFIVEYSVNTLCFQHIGQLQIYMLSLSAAWVKLADESWEVYSSRSCPEDVSLKVRHLTYTYPLPLTSSRPLY